MQYFHLNGLQSVQKLLHFCFYFHCYFYVYIGPKSKVIDSSHYSYLNLLRIVKLKANNKLVVENIFLERLNTVEWKTQMPWVRCAFVNVYFYFPCSPHPNGLFIVQERLYFSLSHHHTCLYIKVNYHDIISILTLLLFFLNPPQMLCGHLVAFLVGLLLAQHPWMGLKICAALWMHHIQNLAFEVQLSEAWISFTLFTRKHQ